MITLGYFDVSTRELYQAQDSILTFKKLFKDEPQYYKDIKKIKLSNISIIPKYHEIERAWEEAAIRVCNNLKVKETLYTYTSIPMV